jgi:hypothetical protein
VTEQTRDTWDEPGDEGVLDDADSLASDDMEGDPLDDAIEAGDRYSVGEGWGNTAAEARQGESLDQHLAEEEPDESADPADSDADTNAEPFAAPDEAAGRLVTDDEGLGPDRTKEEVATVASEDNSGRTAEEDAMHIRSESGERNE